MAELDIRKIRIFVEVAQQRSFIRAAEHLHVAQPWLSVQVRQLEEQIGFALFHRNRNRAVTLTQEAEAFLTHAHHYLDAAREVLMAAKHIKGMLGTSLRIGAPEFSAAIGERKAVIDAILNARPDIELEIVNGWSCSLIEQLLGEDIDLAFLLAPFATEGLQVIPLRRYSYAMLMTKEQAAHHGPAITASDLAGMHVATFRRHINPALHDHMLTHLEEHKAVVHYLQEPSMIGIQHYVDDAGIPALTGEWQVFTGQVADHLTLVPLAVHGLHFDLCIARRSNDSRPGIGAFWEIARSLRVH